MGLRLEERAPAPGIHHDPDRRARHPRHERGTAATVAGAQPTDVEQQAEDNVIERLSKAGLLSPPGDVDKVLDTVVRNLQITNNLNIEPPVKTRVLLTSPWIPWRSAGRSR